MVGLCYEEDFEILKRVFSHNIVGVLIPIFALMTSAAVSFLVATLTFDVFDTYLEDSDDPGVTESIAFSAIIFAVLNGVVLQWSTPRSWHFRLLLTLYNLARPPLFVLTYSQGYALFMIFGCYIDLLLILCVVVIIAIVKAWRCIFGNNSK